MNFETDRIVITAYPSGAGGKFLLNCLGLSNQFLLQDINLSLQQINGNLSSLDKFNLLIDRLQQITHHWTDLGLGCREMFGIENIRYHRVIVQGSSIQGFFPQLETVTNSNYYFGLVSHSKYGAERMLTVWNNATVLALKNTVGFIKTWRPKAIIDVGNEYNSSHDIDLSQTNPKKLLTWDCENFFHVHDFVTAMQKLYENFELNDFDSALIGELYHEWIQALSRVSKAKQ